MADEINTNNAEVQQAVNTALKEEKKKKKKKKWIIVAVIAVVIILIIAIAGGSGSGDDADTGNSGSSSVSAQGEEKSDGTIGDYGCVVKGASLCKDWTDKDAVLVTYEFTNNSDSAISFDVALDARAYQDGVGLETAILDNEETDWLDVDIKPGVTKEVKKAYVLRDTSTPVEIEVSELISFSDEKLVTTVEIAQ
ncbi:MAG: DUF5067 domain-containing protein [Eubacterium sp.]